MTEIDERNEDAAESPRNVEAFLRVSTVDTSLSRVDPRRSLNFQRVSGGGAGSNVVPLAEHVRQCAQPETPGHASRPPRVWVWALAAFVVIAGIVGTGGATVA